MMAKRKDANGGAEAKTKKEGDATRRRRKTQEGRRKAKRAKAASRRIPPAITASAAEDPSEDAKDLSRARKRQRLRDRRAREERATSTAKPAAALPEKERRKKRSKTEEPAGESKKAKARKTGPKEMEDKTASEDLEEMLTSSAGADGQKGGKKSRRLKAKLKARRRRRKTKKSGSGSEEALESGEEMSSGEALESDMEVVSPSKDAKRRKAKKASKARTDESSDVTASSAIEEIDEASEEAPKRSRKRKTKTKAKKAKSDKAKKRISPDSAELEDEGLHSVDEAGEAVKDLPITLDRPAIAKRQMEDARKAKEGESAKAKKAKKAKTKAKSKKRTDDSESGETVGSAVEDSEEISEAEPPKKTGKAKNAKKPKKAKSAKSAKNAKNAKNEDDAPEEVSEVEEVSEIEEISEVEEISSMEEIEEDAPESKKKGKAGVKAKSLGATKSLKRGTGKNKEDKSKAARRRGSAKRGRSDDEEEFSETKGGLPLVPIAAMAGVIVILIVMIVSLSKKPKQGIKDEGKVARIERETELLRSAMKKADMAGAAGFQSALEGLMVAQRLQTDTGRSSKLSAAVAKLKKRQEQRQQTAWDKILAAASKSEEEARFDMAHRTASGYPLALRGSAVFRNEALPYIEQLEGKMRAEEAGRALLSRAKQLKTEQNYDRALGLLAGFSKAFKGTEAWDEIKILRDQINGIRSKFLENQERLQLAQKRSKAQAAKSAKERESLDRLLATEQKGKWIKQLGKDLFTWQVRNDREKGLWSVSGNVLSCNNSSNAVRILAKNKLSWKSAVIRFEVKLKRGKWGFLHRVLKVSRKQPPLYARLEPTNSTGGWVKIKLYAVGGSYFQVISGERKELNPSENTAKDVGGFGFWIGPNTSVEFRNIEAMPLERK